MSMHRASLAAVVIAIMMASAPASAWRSKSMTVPSGAPTKQTMKYSSTTFLPGGKVQQGQPGTISYQRIGATRRSGQLRLTDAKQVIRDGAGKELYRQNVTFVSSPKGSHPARQMGDAASPIDLTVMTPRRIEVGQRWSYNLNGTKYEAKVVGTKQVTTPDGKRREGFLVLQKTRMPLSDGGMQEMSTLTTIARGVGAVSHVSRQAYWNGPDRGRPAGVSFMKHKVIEHKP